MMNEGMAVMALNADWVNSAGGSAMLWGNNDGYQQLGAISSGLTYTGGVCYCNSYPCACHHTVTYRYWPYQVEGRKIRLTLSEVDTLRAAAKKDKELRDVLRKLTPHIEVEVTL